MEELVLNDRSVVPTDKYIFSLLGEKKILWQDIHKYLEENNKDAAGTWNYYNDGKRWLYKMVLKKKTIFWGSLLKEGFRITFYYGDKALPLLEESSLPEKIITEFKNAKKYGAIRPVTLQVTSDEEVEIIRKLIEIKIKLK
jgi:hypothetical protein